MDHVEALCPPGVSRAVPCWNGGRDTLPEPREVLLTPPEQEGHLGRAGTFAVRMPVEMRLGRPLFIELLWFVEGAGGLSRHSIRRCISETGEYLGTAFGSFVCAPGGD